jgi:hypothetical protein
MHLASDLGSKSMSIRASLLFLLLPSSMIVLTVMEVVGGSRFHCHEYQEYG